MKIDLKYKRLNIMDIVEQQKIREIDFSEY
jgi:hypothetical protein